MPGTIAVTSRPSSDASATWTAMKTPYQPRATTIARRTARPRSVRRSAGVVRPAVAVARHQVAAEREQPEHRGVHDHPLGPAMADRPEDRPVACVADDHEDDEDEPDRARQDA